jgi:hypothetical protein
MRALIVGTIGSRPPERTRVGALMRCSHGRLDQPATAASWLTGSGRARKETGYNTGPFEFGERFTFESSTVNSFRQIDRGLGDLLEKLYKAVEPLQAAVQVLSMGLDYRQ